MTDYSPQIELAYSEIRDKGGQVVFDSPAEAGVPADPDAPWEGNNNVGAPFNHYALLLPLDANARTSDQSNHRVLIPAKNLPFEIRKDMDFVDSAGRKFTLTAITELAPDPAQLILYDCECALWPAAS